MLYPIVLCGGDGTRLWPASRKALPKQFMPLRGTTLFKETVRRALHIPQAKRAFIVCNQSHRFLAAGQLQELATTLDAPQKNKILGSDENLKKHSMLLEPVGRNTAPAIALAALHVQELHQENRLEGKRPIMLVLPADHLMPDPTPFEQAIAAALPAAMAGKLITFGVVPHAPKTGFGYIKKGTLLPGTALPSVFQVEQFVEKPDELRATRFVASKEYYWNSGIFMFTPQAFLQELALFAPTIHAQCEEAYAKRHTDLDFIRVDQEAFGQCPPDSIDYAVMEKTAQACVVPLAAQWSDLGSWDSLYETSPHDNSENATEGNAVLKGCTNTFVSAESRLVTGLGLDAIIVVETSDAVLVASKDQVQDIKQLVSLLKTQKRPEAEEHSRVYRPWGSYESLVKQKGFQVKRIIVNPGQRLSLQKHHKRAEHWVVVQGTATVRINERETLLKEDESTYIPIGAVHCLGNNGKTPLEIIEVQTGAYLGEDDIVRLEDMYGR